MKHLQLLHSYQNLPEFFYAPATPEKVSNPQAIVINQNLAKSIGIDISPYKDDELAQFFSGSKLPSSASPIAQAYAGHQFGYLNNLGDGRAILIGEIKSPDGSLLDMQLKGAGRTAFSRHGDGKATLSSMLREYLISEAMANLGIPTTRSLAVTSTGEYIHRTSKEAAAVLVRVAKSHLRVGTFVYANILSQQQNNPKFLKSLCDYAIHRHYPALSDTENPALALLEKVIEQQITLLNHWLRVGFIHGVLNTDNVTISGETIDYGPCAFMDTYHHDTVYSSIDRNGRYAFGKQASMTQWNLARFAEALLPLINEDKEKAIELASEKLENFLPQQKTTWFSMMRKKLGILTVQKSDSFLIEDLLAIMQKQQLDYTNTFVELTKCIMSEEYDLPNNKQFTNWQQQWLKRVEQKNRKSLSLMQTNNPIIIPRNHLVEQALTDATTGDMSHFSLLLEKLESPYQWDNLSTYSDFQTPPSQTWQSHYQTFCGT